MEGKLQTDEMGLLQGQANVWQLITGQVDAMAVRSAAELRIADIINSHGAPISLSKIAADIASPSLNMSGLKCLMRFLVHKKVFDEIVPDDDDDDQTLYGLNHSSKWLLHDSEFTLAPQVWLATDPIAMAPWPLLGRSIKEGGGSAGTAFKMGNGLEMWELASTNPDYNGALNAGMACTAKITTDAILRCYKGGFEGIIGTLVDVGGGSGAALGEIVKAHPHLKGINFDLPHVVAAAVANNNNESSVTNVGGDMFEAIPPADAVLMKWIMHDWSDQDCVRILKNCRKAIPEKTGKVIIVEMIMQVGGGGDDEIGPFDDICRRFDLIMFAEFSGGKERKEIEWKKILQEGGFPRYKITKIPAMQSIIEAYPE